MGLSITQSIIWGISLGHFKFLINMIDHGLKNVAVMGTMHEVGYWEGAIDENTPCKPLSQYGIAKNALRQALLAYAAGKDVNVYWLRAYYILGDDAHNHSDLCKDPGSWLNEGKTTFPVQLRGRTSMTSLRWIS
jgi:nucleoside-diphosphate-sugar epimerase